MTNLNDLAIKHLVFFWHTCDSSEAHLEDDISARVLDVPIADLPVFLLIVLAEKEDDIAVLGVTSAHKCLLNPVKIAFLVNNLQSKGYLL